MKSFLHQMVMKDLSQFSLVYLIPLSDFHEGARDADHEESDGYINWIKTHDNAFTILNGDMMNCAWKESTPELWEDLVTPDTAYAMLRARLMPIKNKILMITRGGHEGTIFRKVGADYSARLAYDLGDIPYRPDGGLCGIRLGKSGHTAMVWIYATHGWGGARTIGAKVNKAEELAKVVRAHIYVISHDHTPNIHPGDWWEPPTSGIRFDRPAYEHRVRRLYVNTGGFVDYGGYIRNKGYTAQPLRTPRVRIELKNSREEDYHIDIHASI